MRLAEPEKMQAKMGTVNNAADICIPPGMGRAAMSLFIVAGNCALPIIAIAVISGGRPGAWEMGISFTAVGSSWDVGE